MPHKWQIRYALFTAKVLKQNKIFRKWFARFRNGNFELEDQERPSRPSTTGEDPIEAEIENNVRLTLRQLTGMLNKSKSTIYEHIVMIGSVNRLPQDLSLHLIRAMHGLLCL